MTYTLSLYSDISKLYLNKTGGKVFKKQTLKRCGEKRTLEHC